jgi:hypothetical protein
MLLKYFSSGLGLRVLILDAMYIRKPYIMRYETITNVCIVQTSVSFVQVK